MATKESATYRFGIKAPDQQAAWLASQQTFGALILRTTLPTRSDYMLGEFALVEVKGVPAFFVDLVRGILIPFDAVLWAEPA